MRRYYAVIDTNVVVSAALKWNSVPGNIVSLAFDGLIVPVLSDEILDEYQEVLKRPKFHLTDEIVENILGGMKEHGLFVKAETLEIVLPDPKDRVFYEVVLEGRKEKDAYLVSGNTKHFPVKPFVVTPRQMLDIILNDETL